MAIIVLMCVEFTEIMSTAVGLNVTPLGPVHDISTVTGIFTNEFNSTVQVRVGEDPAKGLAGDAVTFTDNALGTV